MKRPEEALQRSVAAYLDVALPDDAVWYAIPNQRGTRSKVENMILKGLGVKAGVPDICIVYDFASIYIELKAEGRKLSKSQIAMRDRLIRALAQNTSFAAHWMTSSKHSLTCRCR